MLPDIDKLRIVHYPHPILRRKADPVDQIDDQIRHLAARMLDLMHEAPGVGLAAVQVGVSLRLFVANTDPEHGREADQVFINPVLRDPSRELADHEEGCLSLPDITGSIRRPRQITIDALNEHGQPVTLTSDDLAARVWQHETDHLDAVLIIDRMTPLDRSANRRLLRELEQDTEVQSRRRG